MAEEPQEPDLGEIGGKDTIAGAPIGPGIPVEPDLSTVHGSNTIANEIKVFDN